MEVCSYIVPESVDVHDHEEVQSIPAHSTTETAHSLTDDQYNSGNSVFQDQSSSHLPQDQLSPVAFSAAAEGNHGEAIATGGELCSVETHVDAEEVDSTLPLTSSIEADNKSLVPLALQDKNETIPVPDQIDATIKKVVKEENANQVIYICSDDTGGQEYMTLSVSQDDGLNTSCNQLETVPVTPSTSDVANERLNDSDECSQKLLVGNSSHISQTSTVPVTNSDASTEAVDSISDYLSSSVADRVMTDNNSLSCTLNPPELLEEPLDSKDFTSQDKDDIAFNIKHSSTQNDPGSISTNNLNVPDSDLDKTDNLNKPSNVINDSDDSESSGESLSISDDHDDSGDLTDDSEQENLQVQNTTAPLVNPPEAHDHSTSMSSTLSQQLALSDEEDNIVPSCSQPMHVGHNRFEEVHVPVNAADITQPSEEDIAYRDVPSASQSEKPQTEDISTISAEAEGVQEDVEISNIKCETAEVLLDENETDMEVPASNEPLQTVSKEEHKGKAERLGDEPMDLSQENLDVEEQIGCYLIKSSEPSLLPMQPMMVNENDQLSGAGANDMINSHVTPEHSSVNIDTNLQDMNMNVVKPKIASECSVVLEQFDLNKAENVPFYSPVRNKRKLSMESPCSQTKSLHDTHLQVSFFLSVFPFINIKHVVNVFFMLFIFY